MPPRRTRTPQARRSHRAPGVWSCHDSQRCTQVLEKPARPMTAQLVTNVSNAALALNANGGFSYTPTTGFTGTDTFTYQVADCPGITAIGTVHVTVNPVNDAPLAVADTTSATSGQPRVINVQANDSDVDGTLNAASLAITTPASNGTTSINPANGTVTYTSTAGFIGTATFAYTVADNNGFVSAPATVTVTVVPNNETLTVTRALYHSGQSPWAINSTHHTF